MFRRRTLAGLIVLLYGSVCLLSGQPVPIDSAVYMSFLREVSARADSPPQILKNDSVDLTPVSVQDALGITGDELQWIVSAEKGCEDELNSQAKEIQALVFESRVRAADEKAPSETLAARLRDLEAERGRIILRYVEGLKSSMGQIRFRILEDYIRSRENAGSFFSVLKPQKL